MPAASCIIVVVSMNRRLISFHFLFFYFLVLVYLKFTKNVLNFCVFGAFWCCELVCHLIVIIASVWWMKEVFYGKRKLVWALSEQIGPCNRLICWLNWASKCMPSNITNWRIEFVLFHFMVYWNAREALLIYGKCEFILLGMWLELSLQYLDF